MAFLSNMSNNLPDFAFSKSSFFDFFGKVKLPFLSTYASINFINLGY